MAKLENLIPFIEKWEGGYVNDPNDRGGATNRGVTIATWRTVGHDKDGDGDIDSNDIRLLTREDFVTVLRKHYWNRCQGDNIRSQSVANIWVDWVWCSGVTVIKQVQMLLGVTPDGVVGDRTLLAINTSSARELFYRIKSAREEFVEQICEKRPENLRFRKGWLRRVAAIKWVPILLLASLLLTTGCRSSAGYTQSKLQEHVSEQISVAREIAKLEDVLQSASSSQTVRIGETIEMEILRIEYDSVLPTKVRKETRTRVNRKMEEQQETRHAAELEQQAVSREMEAGTREVEVDRVEEAQAFSTKCKVGWWVVVLLIVICVYVIRRIF